MALTLEHVDYTYSPGSVYETAALKDISLTVEKGEFVGIIGHTGSGKSTLLQILGGLLKPTGGTVCYNGQDIYDSGFSRKSLRSKIGLIFQYPEYQLFEMTVLKDVSYGPKNLGCSEEEAMERARMGLKRAGLPESYWEKSPFELSGGQKRRVAIAGVLAMEPELLVLDEPTAGLDPEGRRELFALLSDLHRKQNMTVVLVSHSMDDVAECADRIAVMKEGELFLDGTPAKIFTHRDELEEAGLALPEVTYLMQELAELGFQVSPSVTTVEEARREIEQYMQSL